MGAVGADRAVHARCRGGGHAPRPLDVGAGPGHRRSPAAAARRARRARDGRDARRGGRARHRRQRDGRRRGSRAARPAHGDARDVRGVRAGGRQRRHAPVRGVARDGGLERRALRGHLRLDARARAARADVRAARPRGRARARGRDPRGQRAARAPAGAARPVGQLAVLAGARQRAGLGAHAALPGLPPRRHPARVRRLRRLRALGRPAAAPPGVPGADVPVVGRPPAAPLRDDRGAHHGRAGHAEGHGSAGRVRAVPGGPRAAQRRGRRAPGDA